MSHKNFGLRGAVTPEDVSNLLPSRPLTSSPAALWRDVELQHYRHPPGETRISGARDDVVLLHIRGKIEVEDLSTGRLKHTWSGPGKISLFPAGHPVIRSWKGYPELMLIFLRPRLVKDVAEELGLDPAGLELRFQLPEPDAMLHRYGRLLCEEAAQPLLGSSLLGEGLARALAIYLLRHYSNRSDVTPNGPSLHTRKLRQVIDYMHAHLDEPITLSELAAIAGLSVTHFSRAFRDAAGKPPHAFLIDLRLERACELLENSELSITQIAFDCGFEQSQYFATLFRRKLGCSPRVWRAARRS
jgi:AraC family transcriptional regulator